MSNEEKFEELDLEHPQNLKLATSEDNISEITIDTINRKEGSQPNPNNENTTFKTNDEPFALNQYYNQFIEGNKEFFERIGFKNITNDPIFYLHKESEIKKNANLNFCEICKKQISRIFSKTKFCKFCGCILCDSCVNLKRKIPNAEIISTICQICENKFQNFQLHEEFKEKLTKKEFEISESNQKLEKYTLLYSEQLDEIRKLTELKSKKKKENELKEEMLIRETNNLILRKQEVSDLSEKMNLKINESINDLKLLENRKKIKEDEFKKVQREREEITFEFEKRQNHLEEVLAKIRTLSMSLKNQEQNEDQIKNKTPQNLTHTSSTGNKHLDMLLKEKQKIQRRQLNEISSSSEETSIIINPSKKMKEVYKERLLDNHEKKEENKRGVFKNLVMYLGSKIFVKDSVD